MHKIVILTLLFIGFNNLLFCQNKSINSFKKNNHYSICHFKNSYSIKLENKTIYKIYKKQLNYKLIKLELKKFKIHHIGLQAYNNDDFENIKNKNHGDIFLVIFLNNEKANLNCRIIYDPFTKTIIEKSFIRLNSMD